MSSDRLTEKTRRDFLKLTAAGVFGAGLSGWLPVLAKAAESGKKTKSCILLWMDGGPSHKDTFDLKPDSKGAGEFKPIKTAAPGIQISELFPFLALPSDRKVGPRRQVVGVAGMNRARPILNQLNIISGNLKASRCGHHADRISPKRD